MGINGVYILFGDTPTEWIGNLATTWGFLCIGRRPHARLEGSVRIQLFATASAILLKLCSQYLTQYLITYLTKYLTKYLTMIFFCIFSHTERWSMVSKPLGGRCCYSQVKAQCWTLRTTLKSDDLQVFFRGFPKLCQFVPGSLPEWMAIAKQMQHLRITQMLFFHQMVATNRLPATCFKHPTKCGGQNNCSAFGKVWTLPDWHVLQLVSYWRVDRSWNPTLQSDWKLEMRLQERFDRTLYPQLAR